MNRLLKATMLAACLAIFSQPVFSQPVNAVTATVKSTPLGPPGSPIQVQQHSAVSSIARGSPAQSPSRSTDAQLEGAKNWVLSFNIVVVTLFALIAVLLGLGRWSLTDALSEPQTVSIDSTKGGQMVVKMVASSSRLIALLGTAVTLCLIISCAELVTFAGLTGKVLPNVAGMWPVMVSLMGCFVPYVARQVAVAAAANATQGAGVPLPDLGKALPAPGGAPSIRGL